MIILVVSVLVGLVWAVLNLTGLVCPKIRNLHLGELTVHSIALTVFLVAVAIIKL
jgi:hypothetical protein